MCHLPRSAGRCPEKLVGSEKKPGSRRWSKRPGSRIKTVEQGAKRTRIFSGCTVDPGSGGWFQLSTFSFEKLHVISEKVIRSSRYDSILRSFDVTSWYPIPNSNFYTGFRFSLEGTWKQEAGSCSAGNRYSFIHSFIHSVSVGRETRLD